MLGQLLSVNISSFPTYSFTYSIPYLLLGLLVCVIGWPWIKGGVQIPFPQKRLLLIMGMFLLFFGLRWHIMSDTIEYSKIYDEVAVNFSLQYISSFSERMEAGFIVFIIFCKAIGMDFHFFLFVNSLIDFWLLYLCIKKYSLNIPLTCLLFLAFNGINIEFNLMRNFKAMLLFFYSLDFIKDRQLIKFLLVQLLATTFHTSALLFIPMYLLLRRQYSFWILVAIGVVSTYIYLFNGSILQDLILSHILETDEVSKKLISHATDGQVSVLTLGTIERIGTLFLVLCMYHTHKEKPAILLILCNMFFVYYSLFSLFGFNNVFRDRIPNLFVPVYWFIYPYIITYYKKKIPSLGWVMIVFSLLKIYSGTHMCSAYYETVLFHDTSVQEREQLCDKAAN